LNTNTVRQHYVSQTYLRHWCHEDGFLRASGKLEGKELTIKPNNILFEKHYYEGPSPTPPNELERMFGRFESAYASSSKILTMIERNAIKLGQPVASTLADALENLPHHATALKEFAATTYFRTPAALTAMKEQLAADDRPLALEALEAMGSAYELCKQGFESSLLERFHNLHMLVGYGDGNRLITGDWPCYPLAFSEPLSNFGYDIGRNEAAAAGIAITPNIYILFLSNSHIQKPRVIGQVMSVDLVDQANELVSELATRWVVR
jgi:hypothetical protein